MGWVDDTERYLFHEGTNAYAYRMMGAHKASVNDKDGYRYCVWAPNALEVSVVGDFNNWNPLIDKLTMLDGGIWTGFVITSEFASYKYAIKPQNGAWLLKADPYAYHAETRPQTASKTYDLAKFNWSDEKWMTDRVTFNPYHSPINIYEMHIGSWQRQEDGNYLDYIALGERLLPYLLDMNYTHVQFMPISEHPLDMSWGYQVTGFYAPTSRFGTPDMLMKLIDMLHNAGIGVLLDWVPAHFPKDAQGLRRFDGIALYEHEDPRQGENFGWGTHIFNYGRCEVQSFLLSNAVYWLDCYHIDGLRVDAVSSMLFLDFCRENGGWLPNKYGGNENIEAIEFLRKLNTIVYRDYPGVMMMAEESSNFPMVTRPTYLGGLGFGFKWNMGWMNDVLKYAALDPIFRKYEHHKVTFSMMYAFNENYILPLSHDEVVHGKFSLLNRFQGDYWRKFAGLRALFGYTMAHPGKKLLFMGGEFGQFIEWKYDDQLDWFLLKHEKHFQIKAYVKALNAFYREHSAFWQIDDSWNGFRWLNANDSDNSVLSFLRIDKKGEAIVAIINFTPVYHPEYRIGLPLNGMLFEVLNSDLSIYGGSGQCNPLPITSEAIPWNGFSYSANVSVPPLSALYLQYEPHGGLLKALGIDSPRTIKIPNSDVSEKERVIEETAINSLDSGSTGVLTE